MLLICWVFLSIKILIKIPSHCISTCIQRGEQQQSTLCTWLSSKQYPFSVKTTKHFAVFIFRWLYPLCSVVTGFNLHVYKLYDVIVATFPKGMGDTKRRLETLGKCMYAFICYVDIEFRSEFVCINSGVHTYSIRLYFLSYKI